MKHWFFSSYFLLCGCFIFLFISFVCESIVTVEKVYSLAESVRKLYDVPFALNIFVFFSSFVCLGVVVNRYKGNRRFHCFFFSKQKCSKVLCSLLSVAYRQLTLHMFHATYNTNSAISPHKW